MIRKLSKLKSVDISELRREIDTNDELKYKHLWVILSNSPSVKNFFMEFLPCPHIDEFISEALSPPSKVYDDGMEKIQMAFSMENYVDELLPEWRVYGVGPKDSEIYPDASERYTLEMSPLNNLGNYPFVICDEIESYNLIEKDKPSRIKALCRPRMLDVFDCILSDASFFGSPKKRDRQVENLKKLINDTKNIDNKYGM